MKMSFLLSAAILVVAPVADAAPVRWSVDQLSLTDGSTVSGGFTYDASLDLVSDTAITLATTSPGSPYQLTHRFYPTLGGLFFAFTETAAADYTGQATLWIWVTSPLTDAGGAVPIDTSVGYGWGVCNIASCLSASNPGDLRGSLVGVPEPGMLALLCLGLGGVVASRKRRGVGRAR